MKEKLLQLKTALSAELDSVKDDGALEAIKVKYLGKKSELMLSLRSIGQLSAEESCA